MVVWRLKAAVADLYDGYDVAVIAHIAGIPLEETIAMAVPVLGATYVALLASLRSRWRDSKRG